MNLIDLNTDQAAINTPQSAHAHSKMRTRSAESPEALTDISLILFV